MRRSQNDYEKDLSTVEATAGAKIRVLEAHSHQERPRCFAQPSAQRTQKAVACLILDGGKTFPKRERLQRGFQFRHVYEQGRKVEGRLAVVYVLEAAPEERAVGVVTSRRIGGAVVRNRARRLLREVYRLNKHKLKPNLQIVMVARTAINGKRLQEVETNVLQLLEAAGVINQP